jgi:hypothetical protein
MDVKKEAQSLLQISRSGSDATRHPRLYFRLHCRHLLPNGALLDPSPKYRSLEVRE